MDITRFMEEEERDLLFLVQEAYGELKMANYQEFFIRCTECQQVAKWACLASPDGILCCCTECDYQEVFDSWDEIMNLVVEEEEHLE